MKFRRKTAIGLAASFVMLGMLVLTPIESYPSLGIGAVLGYGAAGGIATTTVASTNGAAGATLLIGGGGGGLINSITSPILSVLGSISGWITDLMLAIGL